MAAPPPDSPGPIIFDSKKLGPNSYSVTASWKATSKWGYRITHRIIRGSTTVYELAGYRGSATMPLVANMRGTTAVPVHPGDQLFLEVQACSRLEGLPAGGATPTTCSETVVGWFTIPGRTEEATPAPVAASVPIPEVAPKETQSGGSGNGSIIGFSILGLLVAAAVVSQAFGGEEG